MNAPLIYPVRSRSRDMRSGAGLGITSAVRMRHWAEPYIGLPFDDIEFNCWGLVRLVFAREKGIELPAYAEISARDVIRIARAMNDGGSSWASVSDPRSFDLLRMYGDRSGVPIHVGVMTSPTHVLHIERGIDSVHLPITHPTLRNRLAGFYRHAACA